MKAIWLSVYCTLWSIACEAQEFAVQHYTTDAGLPSNMVYDIYRDSRGYLWLGTDNGVARYNGIQFETFSVGNGLPDKEIFFFKEDYQGRIWMSTFNGELCYYQHDKFHSGANTPFLQLPFQRSDTKFITVHPDSSISIYFMNGKDYFINISGDRVRTIDISKIDLVATDLQSITKKAANEYELLAGNRNIMMDEKGNVLRERSTAGNRSYFLSYTQDSVYLFDNRAVYNLQQQEINQLQTTKAGKIIRVYRSAKNLFTGTANGLFAGDRQMLAGNKISSITEDINGNIWIGTLGNGVFKLKRNYRQYTIQKGAYQGIASCSFSANNKMLFATSANHLYSIQTGNPGIELVANLALPSESVQYLDSHLFYAGNGHAIRLAQHDGKGQQQKTHTLNFGNPKALIVQDSTAYYHCLDDVLVGQFHKGMFTSVTQRSSARIFCMAQDARKQVWFTTRHMYTIAANKPIRQHQFDGLSFKWFRFFDDLFVGTTQAGALVVTKKATKKNIDYRTVQDDCAWENAYRIDNRHILLATDGLYRVMTIQPSAADTATFSIAAIENEFIPRDAEHIAANGTDIYFFSKGAIYTLPIQELLAKPARPIISAIQFYAGKTEHNSRHSIHLSHADARNILINIKSLSFDSKDLRYLYSISEDNEEEWHTTMLPQINLVSPGYGNYQVKIKAVTISGVASEPYTFQLTILKPFYLQWWFLAAAAMFLGALALLAIRVRIHYLLHKREKEYRLKMKVLKSEYKAMNALMNPHFIFNSLNSIQGFINKGNKEAANRYLHLFSHLMRQNMHNISRELVTLAEEIKLVQNYLLLEKMRYDDRFEYSVDVDDDIEEEDLFIPPLLIQPLAENAIKHGLLPRQSNDNRLRIRIYSAQQKLIIEVVDNGLGFSDNTSEDGHQSFALGNIRSRIAQLNELHHQVIQLDIDSGASGTKVIVTIDTQGLSNTPKDRF